MYVFNIHYCIPINVYQRTYGTINNYNGLKISTGINYFTMLPYCKLHL